MTQKPEKQSLWNRLERYQEENQMEEDGIKNTEKRGQGGQSQDHLTEGILCLMASV